MATLTGVVGTALLAFATVCLTSGCSTLGYYAQAASGHLDLLQRARPVPELLADAATPPALRERLVLSQQMRDFAVRELKLPDNNSYRRFADLQRSAAVWNVVAAPELSLTLQTWCFPLIGCVGYRGYYERAGADTLATELRQAGLETQVYGVPAYSTLGWSNWVGGDPLLNTFIRWPDAELARLIFHELAHQVAFTADDTMFNESFATAVERIGSRLWLQQQQSAAASAALAEQQRAEVRKEDFRLLTQGYRDELAALYRSSLPVAEQRQRKTELMAALRRDHETLKTTRWGGFAGYDAWIRGANNASFAVLSAYNGWVPAFEKLFESEGRDFTRFYAAVKGLAAMPSAERQAKLAAL